MDKVLFSIIFGITLSLVYAPPAFGGLDCEVDEDCSPISTECQVGVCIGVNDVPPGVGLSTIGFCELVPRLFGTPCGSDLDDECTNPDTCDDFGSCQDNDEPPGKSCGDPTNSECTNPDSCDGSGLCLDNNEPPETPCEDGDVCTEGDLCFSGVCLSGPFICPVGGEFLPIDSSALLLAGVQANALWLIPVIVAATGIGIVIARKF